MWRNVRSSILSARAFQSSSASPGSFSYPHFVYSKAILQPIFSQSHSSCSSSSSPLITSSSTPKLQIRSNGSDDVRAFASLADGVSFKVRDAVEFARRYAQCYWELSKARLSMLVVATSGTGYILGSGNAVDFAGLCWTCAGTMMVAASANSLNQVFEITNDAKMKRTMNRPLPSGRINVPHAATWASCVGAAGTAMLAYKTNMLAAGFAASNLVLYAFVYTPLKQIHPVNTWIGAVVGAIPPLLGWAAASGQVSLNAMILPAALYFWQIPHFMALAYLCRNDYAAGGYKMFSLMDPSGQRTAAVALRNCLYMVPLGFLCYDWGITAGWFCIESTALTLAITATAFSFFRDRTTKKARRMFHASLLYHPVFMSGLLFHRLSDNQQLNNVQTSTDMMAATNEQDIDREQKNSEKYRPSSGRTGPPVAYASVAPFPFLPAPAYADA